MSEATTEFDIGSEVTCTDGACGVLGRVVLDPIAKAITHLVVGPKHGHAASRLVPIGSVTSAGTPIQLNCTKAQFDGLDEADESEYLPVGPVMGYERGDVFMLPFYGLHLGGEGPTSMPLISGTTHSEFQTEVRVPTGDVELRRGDPVHATDGDIGHIEGLVVDPSDHHVTHFLLREGHRWGQKHVAIPIGAVAHVGDVIRLSLTMDQVRDLPAVDVDHPLA
jgi:sporulation protein YlmC with PRC-barrel domain